jgi:hypothetical protein
LAAAEPLEPSREVEAAGTSVKVKCGHKGKKEGRR